MSEHAYWIGWCVHGEVPEAVVQNIENGGLLAWWTGGAIDDSYSTWCGLIESALSPEAAWQRVLDAYGPHAGQLQKRWEPSEKPLGWTPGDRFQMRASGTKRARLLLGLCSCDGPYEPVRVRMADAAQLCATCGGEL